MPPLVEALIASEISTLDLSRCAPLPQCSICMGHPSGMFRLLRRRLLRRNKIDIDGGVALGELIMGSGRCDSHPTEPYKNC
eukprot:COSAG02_NODE_52101_length_310_cov_0.597156_1_plen_80_part_01